MSWRTIFVMRRGSCTTEHDEQTVAIEDHDVVIDFRDAKPDDPCVSIEFHGLHDL